MCSRNISIRGPDSLIHIIHFFYKHIVSLIPHVHWLIHSLFYLITLNFDHALYKSLRISQTISSSFCCMPVNIALKKLSIRPAHIPISCLKIIMWMLRKILPSSICTESIKMDDESHGCTFKFWNCTGYTKLVWQLVDNKVSANYRQGFAFLCHISTTETELISG